MIVSLALGWKIGLSILLFMVGLGVAGAIGANDIMENFETGFGPKTKTRQLLSIIFFAGGVVAAIAVFFI